MTTYKALAVIALPLLAATAGEARADSWRYRSSPGYGRPVPARFAVEEQEPRAGWLTPQLRLSLGGTMQTAGSASGAMGGVAVALQAGLFRHTLLGIELQSVGTFDEDRVRRDDVAGLVTARVLPWRGPVAPYLEVAAGVGGARVRTGGYQARTSLLLARYGIGLELRLGHHVVLDGQLAQLHRFATDGAANPYVGDQERATELRAGLGFRF
jgi:hypothetical protein